MKSKIQIALGDKNQPVINFNVSRSNEDVRDILCSQFIEALDFTSNFCTIEPKESSPDGIIEWVIKPVGISGLQELQKRVQEAIKVSKT